MTRGRRGIALVVAIGALLAAPAAASGEVLYDQTDSPGVANADPGQDNFAPSNFFGPGDEDRTADDFTVPAGEIWTLSEIAVGGAYEGPGATQEVNAYVYANAGGEPGTELFSQLGIPSSGPDYEVPLTAAPPLSAGTYWITVQQRDASDAFWSWQTRTVQTGNPAQWRTDSAGPGCTNVWEPRLECWNGSNPDQIFRLEGTRATPEPAAKPKLTLGKLERNKKRGTAKQPAYVNVPGTVELSGKNVETKTKSASAPGTLKLKVKPRGKTLEKLEEQGRARTKITVLFTPNSGAGDTVERQIVLRLAP